MKTLALLLAIILSTSISFSQTDEVKYVNIPEISKNIVVKGDGIKIGSWNLQYMPEYDYDNGLRFGSWIQIHVDDIENSNSYEDVSFLLVRYKLFRKSDGQLIGEKDWHFVDTGHLEKEEDKDNLFYYHKFKLGTDMYSGEYVYEVEFANICNKKTTKGTIPFKIIPNPFITTTTKGNAQYDESYFWSTNSENGFIYCVPELQAGTVDITVDGIRGFKLDDKIAKIGLEVIVYDAESGEEAFNTGDLATGTEAFVEAKDGKFNAFFNLRMGENTIGSKLKIKMRVWDKNDTGNEVNFESTVTVVK